jgi:hypothetical protein
MDKNRQEKNMTQETQSSTWKWFMEKILLPLLLALLAGYISLVAAKILAPPFIFQTTSNIAGVWEGTEPTSSGDFLIRVSFASDCKIGKVCGKVEIPEANCTAFPVLLSISGDTYIFKETDHTDGCFPATGNDTIKVMENGTLLFGSNGSYPTLVLYKK